MKLLPFLFYLLLYFTLASGSAQGPPDKLSPALRNNEPDVRMFLNLLKRNTPEQAQAIKRLDVQWKPELLSPTLDVMSLTRDIRLFTLLEKKTGQTLGPGLDPWLQWLWSKERSTPDYYPDLKALVYGSIDPRFSQYFSSSQKRTIRLDEIRWGGVVRDGIPPMKNPKMLPAAKATYLQDDNVVFGISVNGDSRAYPKRILAWHEMFKDRIGGVEVAGVYCTLCGSMIVYDTDFDGKHHELGTSGFLYRSNKLMYDHATKSMWSTISGEPVVGKLVGKGIKLESLSVVTTTWGEWKRLHPKTTVLSTDTGYTRDYGEGVAYHDYFASDRLMFTVPKIDKRLKNKAEVLAFRFGSPSDTPLAFASSYLQEHPIVHGTYGTTPFVILTDSSGAHRVFESSKVKITTYKDGIAIDAGGSQWQITEAGLIGTGGKTLPRLASHNAFWFGWYAAHPDTELVH